MTAVAAALALLLVSVSTASADRPRLAPTRPESKPFADVRTPELRKGEAPGAAALRALAPAAREARERLVRRLGGQTVLNADPLTATPRMLGRLDGTLTGPRAGDPADVALGYVDDHAAALGLAPSDLATLRLEDRVQTGGITYLRWRQEVQGVPVLDNDLQAAVDGDGRLVNVTGAPRRDLGGASVTPALSASDARAAVARDVGVDHPATVTEGPSGPRRETTFSTGDRAALVLFGDTGGTRLAWQVTFKAGSSAWYDAVVDAATGAILRRANMVDSLVDASVFDNFPGAPLGGSQRTVSLDAYLTDPATATTLAGPNAHAWSDIDDASATTGVEAPQPSEEIAPGSVAFNSFNATNSLGACDVRHLCSWDGGVASSWETNRRQNAIQAFWYVNRFHDHLASPPIGFDAASGAFDGGDALNLETDDGANLNAGFPDGPHLDNANMATPPDGQRPTMQMYLFVNAGPTSPFRDVNGGDDASIVYHEYTHGLSNRLIADATGAGALDRPQPAAMGEAWSDWYAKDFLVNEGVQTDTAIDGEVDMGAYVDSVPNQIRSQPLDCSVGSTAARCPGTNATGRGGYTYGDFGVLGGATDPHIAGEIWGETLWDLRKLLGSSVTEAIITGGMRLSPVEPSFLDERNAILQADAALFGRIHQSTIWGVFANRGMGFLASTAGPADATPAEDFSLPPGSTAGPAPVPVGGATPQAVPAGAASQPAPGRAVSPVQVPSRPTVRVDRSTVRGRATVTFGCSSACRATATMTVSRATARSAGLGRTTRLARVTRRLGGAGRGTFAVTVSKATLRTARARRVRTLGVTVTVAIRDSRGQTRSLKRALRVRIR